MRLRWRASAGFLLRHRWQLVLSVLGIAIGVAVIVAVDLANASARKAFLLSMDAISGEVTHQVIGGPLGVDDEVYRQLKREHGLPNIAPVVEGEALLDGRRFTVVGIDPFAEQAMRSRADARLAGDPGGFLLTRDAVLLSRRTAAALGLSVGDPVKLDAGGRAVTATLTGTFGGDEAGPLDTLMTVDIATAKRWFDSAGKLARIDVRLDSDADVAAFRALLPPGTALLDAAGRTRTTLDLSAAFMTNLQAMSLLALLVGLFLIYNSVSFSVLQRRSLIGSLRALGLTRAGVLRQILGEALLLGTLASLLGLALGHVLGEQLLGLVSRTINDLYFRVSVTDVSTAPWTLSKGLVAGVATSLFAALMPALEAASFQPRLAMQRSSLERRTGAALGRLALVGGGLLATAAAMLALSGENLAAGLAAVFVMILGFALCIPLAVRIVARWLEPLAAAIGGLPMRLAVAGVGASLSRTGVAVVALAVAVSATIGVSVMVASFRLSVSDWLAQALQADFYVSAEAGPLPAALPARIGELDGIEHVSTSRRARLEDSNGLTQVLAIDMHPGAYQGTDIIAGDADEAWAAWEDSDVVFVSEPYAYKHGTGVGESILLRSDSGPTAFRIAAVYQSYDVNAGAIMMSRNTYDRHFDDDRVDALGLYLADATEAEVIEERIRALLPPGVVVNSNRDIRALSLTVFDRTFVITDVLYWLAIGVAFVGILSSMLALQLENGREQGTLRALGMTRGQLGQLITTQTGTIGLLSGLASLPLGAAMAWVLISVINRRAFGWQIDMVFAPATAAEAVLFAIGAAILAGLYPAYRAARVMPAAAMREE